MENILYYYIGKTLKMTSPDFDYTYDTFQVRSINKPTWT